jgi:hypothetical protein
LAENIFLDELVETYILFGDPATQAILPTNFPYVEDTSPANGAQNIAIDQSIQITFSKPIDVATVVLGGSGAAGRTFTPTWNPEHTIVTLAHSGFTRGLSYQLSVTAKDEAGIALGEGTVPSAWNFTTSNDATPPTLTIDDPVIAGASFTIQLHFSEPMRPQSVVVTIEPEAGEGLGVEWSDDGMTATVSLAGAAQLQSGQEYILRVTAGKDLAGNALAAPVEKTFTFTATRQLYLPNASKVEP